MGMVSVEVTGQNGPLVYTLIFPERAALAQDRKGCLGSVRKSLLILAN